MSTDKLFETLRLPSPEGSATLAVRDVAYDVRPTETWTTPLARHAREDTDRLGGASRSVSQRKTQEATSPYFSSPNTFRISSFGGCQSRGSVVFA